MGTTDHRQLEMFPNDQYDLGVCPKARKAVLWVDGQEMCGKLTDKVKTRGEGKRSTRHGSIK